jgi:hypothetical protein
MTLQDLLNKIVAGAGDRLLDFLSEVALKLPDLAPLANQWMTLLQEAVSLNSLVSLGKALPGEIANIAQGKLDPRDHPSDA